MVGEFLLVVLGLLLAAVGGLWILGERGRLLRPSSWKGLRAGGLRNLLNLNSLHMYAYGRWTNQYLDVFINRIMPRLGDRGKKWWRDRYHGKILTTELANAIVLVDEDIPLQNLEQIVPYPMAHDLVLSGPPDLAVYECGCRHARAEPCQPTQVCLVVGQPFVDFLVEHNPRSTRRLNQAEALSLLRAEHERGHVHTAWFKDAMLDRFYTICNCCSCCCGGIEAMLRYGNPILASSGYVAHVDVELCEACGICVDTCPFEALSLNGLAAVNWDECMGCGVCVGQCSSEAMTLELDEQKGIPLDVRMLVGQEVAQP